MQTHRTWWDCFKPLLQWARAASFSIEMLLNNYLSNMIDSCLDGSASKSTCCQVWQTVFNSQYPRGRRGQPTLANSLLWYTCTPWHMCMCVFVCACTHTKQINVKFEIICLEYRKLIKTSMLACFYIDNILRRFFKSCDKSVVSYLEAESICLMYRDCVQLPMLMRG